jgi:hypothetical protein
MQIECSNCEMYQTSHCDDCLVTALLHPPEDVVEIDDDLEEPIEALQSSGLIPILRFRPREEPPESEEVAVDTG